MKRALLVGINYKGTSAELNGCINDVRSIREFLIKQCDYQASNIRLLIDEPGNVSPTRSNIEENIRWLVSGNMPGDKLFFHFSGHGAHITDRNGDEMDGRDEVLCPLDFETRGVILDDWLFQNMVSRVVKGCRLWGFTDCCHSGTMFDLKYNLKSNCKYKKGGNVKNIQYNPQDWTNEFSLFTERNGDIPGDVCLFTGCEDNQTSADAFINSKHQGAFTNCLLETLQAKCVRLQDGSSRFESGKLKLKDLLKDVNCRLDIKTFNQNSQMSIGTIKDLEKTFDP
jgi:metacaspase-1